MSLTLLVFLASYLVFACAAPQPLNISRWASKRVLMFAAHPDDIEASAGGTIAQLTAQNTNVFYVIATNGDKGCSNETLCATWTSDHIAFVRRQEAINAGAVLGVPEKNIFFLNYQDAMMTSYPEVEVRMRFIAMIRQIQPDVIMSWFPYPRYQLLPSLYGDLGYHPDHQCVGKLSYDATFDAGNKWIFPEIGDGPWRTTEFYWWSYTDELTHYNDIGTTIDRKIRSFLEHKTQIPSVSQVQQGFYNLGAKDALLSQSGLKLTENFQAYF